MIIVNKVASPKNTKQIINKYGFKFSKSLGQNFLIDTNILQNIINGADLSKEDYVIEVGPGIGSLTQYIADAAQYVTAIEIDKNLIPILKETMKEYENVEIINTDILKMDIQKFFNEKMQGKKVKIIANLPYYVTTPIIMRFLGEQLPIDSLTIMIQKEVAERMKAKEGTKDYGSLSIAVQYYCEPKILFKVPPTVFIPQPKVESTVIRLDIRKKPKVEVEREDLFFNIIKDAFSKRRKTLLNALSSGHLGIEKEKVKKLLEISNIEQNRRGETLTIGEFAIISNNFARCIE